jgi:ubiquinone/menaquinone biosynthesis C-methylase UbiE
VKDTLHLLPPAALIRTSDVDHADWNYRALLGRVQRVRFNLVRRLLEGARYARLLEIGYGSGVFMPELSRRSDALYGIDPHPKHREVQAVLARHGVRAELHSGTAESLPFPDDFFDAIVSVSALEYVPDIQVACDEFRRVLRPGGHLIVCTPGFSPLLDLALRLTTGEKADQYADRRQRLLPTLKRNFTTLVERPVPWITGPLLKLYTGIKLRAD